MATAMETVRKNQYQLCKKRKRYFFISMPSFSDWIMLFSIVFSSNIVYTGISVFGVLVGKTEDGSPKTEDGRRKTEDGRRKTEDGRPKTGDGSRVMGDGRRKTGVRRRESEVGSRECAIIYFSLFHLFNFFLK